MVKSTLKIFFKVCGNVHCKKAMWSAKIVLDDGLRSQSFFMKVNSGLLIQSL
jgi:hypothetical protein